MCTMTPVQKNLYTQTHTEREKEKYNKYQNYFNIADISSIKINNYAYFSYYILRFPSLKFVGNYV